MHPSANPKFPTGEALLHDPARNKGTAFTAAERDALHLRGLLPPHIHTQDEQVRRVLENIRRGNTDLAKYISLMALQDRNETLYYRVLQDHIEEMMPLVYTPTVGQACIEFGHIFRRPRGLFISAFDRGHIAPILRNWPQPDVRCIVVTDGERILGLGDLGADGMGIPIGKLSLYTACAGVNPAFGLPITLDVGTDNESLLHDPLYLGIRQRRLRGAAYDEFIEEFIQAVQEVFPKCLVQFEDFANINAFRLLAAYRERICTFNDDIQGTAAVALAGIYSGLRVTRSRLADQIFLFLGAGEAGIGIAHLIVAALRDAGFGEEDARRRCWFVDSQGLVVRSRGGLSTHKLPFAHDFAYIHDLHEAVQAIKPTALIGVSGKPRTFTRPIVETMARLHARPMIFALSNPTSKAECTAEEAYTWSQGQALFASGSPFAPVTIDGKTHIPGQGNNAYIFPGVGLAITVCGITRVTDEMFFAAARALAATIRPEELEQGRLYPALPRVREVSAAIAEAVAEIAYQRGLTREPRPDDLAGFIRGQMYEPVYKTYV